MSDTPASTRSHGNTIHRGPRSYVRDMKLSRAVNPTNNDTVLKKGI